MLTALVACEPKTPPETAPEPEDPAAATDTPTATDTPAPEQGDYLTRVPSPEPDPFGTDEQLEEAWGVYQDASANISQFANTLANPQRGENDLFSPLSAWLALELLRSGTEGEVQAKLDELLEPVAPLGEGRDLFIRYLTYLYGDPDQPFTVTNLIAVRDDYTIRDDYKKSVRNFQPLMYQMNMADPAAVTEAFNRLIAEKTRGLIPEFFSQPLDPQHAMDLMNITVMDALWSEIFDVADTQEAPFTKADGSQVTCDLMTQEIEYGIFAMDDLASYLKKGYDNGMEMVLILPHEGVTPEEALAQRATGNIPPDQENPVTLNLPRFAFAKSIDLKERLTDLGYGFLFDSLLHGLTEEELSISGILQELKIEVTEEGTKAAAVSDIMLDGAALIPEGEPVTLTFDRPFAFLIYDTNGGIEVFRGIVHDPTAE